MKYLLDWLKSEAQWTNWDYFRRPDGTMTKKPRGKVNDESTWIYFDEADAQAHASFCGVGLMFDKLNFQNVDYLQVGIDIDAHQVAVNPLAHDILCMFSDTYAEMSPSGKGYHILFYIRADAVPFDLKTKYYFKNGKLDLECYIAGYTNRYFTFTGNRLDDVPDYLSDKTDAFLQFLDAYMLRSSDAPEPEPVPLSLYLADQPQQTHAHTAPIPENGTQPKPENITTDKITTMTTGEKEGASLLSPADLQNRLNAMFHAKNGSKAKALFSGSFDGLGYSSQSEAVQALCNYLTFYFGDFGADAVKEVFLSSGLASGKWAERVDIVQSTIQKSFADVHNRYSPRSSSALTAGTSELEEEDKSKKKVIQLADFVMYVDKHGYDMRFNDITKKIDFFGFDRRESPEHLRDIVPVILKDALKVEYRGVTSQVITEYITVLASRRIYNPVLDLITHTEWDGIDRVNQIYNILKIPCDTEEGCYSRVYIQKWLMQCVCALFNDPLDPFKVDMVLVLQGEQGLGKSTFLAHLALSPQYFGDGMCLDPRNKDSIMQITNKWIVELGEIGSTMRKDIDLVKSFITASVDEYRAPYGRTTISYPRRTSIAGTVNEEEYLIDETGSRRFLTIPLAKGLKIDYATQIAPFDSLQLWAQVYQLVKTKNKSSCFRLSPDEEEHLAKRNKTHEKPLKGEADVLDVLAEESGANGKKPNHIYEEREMTVSEFIRHNELKYDARQVTKILKKHGYIPENHRINGVMGRYFKLPYCHYISQSVS